MKKTIRVIMYSTSWCSDCRRVERFFEDNNVSFEKIDIEKDSEARAVVERISNGKRVVPTIRVLFEEQREEVLINPSLSYLQQEYERIFKSVNPAK